METSGNQRVISGSSEGRERQDAVAGGGESAAKGAPQLILLSDGLSYPPRVGYHIHLHAIARSLPPSVPVRVFCWVDPTAPEDLGPDGNGAARGLIEDISAGAPQGKVGRKLHYARRSASWIRQSVPSDSIIWVRGYSTALNLLPYLISLAGSSKRLRFVYDASSFMSLEIGSGMGGFFDSLKGMTEERLWRQFSIIRTLGDPMRDFLIRRGIPEERIRVIPVGSDRRSVRWQAHDSPNRVLYLGSSRAWQGLPKLLAAMELLSHRDPAIQLTVVGARGAPGASGLPNVTYRGRLSHSEAMEFYLQSDLLVIPRERTSLTETVVPMKVVEAMSFGIPILATDLEAIRWVAGHSGALYVQDNSPVTLADAIQNALRRKSDLANVSRSALERVESFYWEKIGERIRDLFFRRGKKGQTT